MITHTEVQYFTHDEYDVYNVQTMQSGASWVFVILIPWYNQLCLAAAGRAKLQIKSLFGWLL